MKFSYRLARMCGAIHENGNVLFGHANELGQTMEGSEEGVNDVLFSAVGNRINVFELAKHASYTMPIEARSDIARMAINHKSTLLIAIDVEGRAMVIGTHRRVVVHRFNFKGRVRYCSFSPNDKLFAVSVGRKIQIWLAPAAHKQVAPFTLHRTITGHVDDITCFDWSADSRYLCSGSKDHTVRVWEATRSDDFIPFTLSAHKSKIVNCFFAEGGSKLYTIADDCALFVWSWVEEEGTTADAADTSLGFFIDKALKKTLTLHPKLGQWKLDKKHFLWMKPSEEEKKAGRKKKKQSRAIASLAGEDNLEYDDGEGHQLTVKCCALHDSLLAVGLSNGSFRLFEMPMLTPLHTLSISKAQVESVSINQSGEWLAFGSPQLGQLLVWEWQSESYVLKQQGHAYDMKAVAFAPDGTIMATGGDDAKVKLWSASSGFCFVTFTQHTAPVTAVEFGPAKGRVLLSASLDGTIRAYDLLR